MSFVLVDQGDPWAIEVEPDTIAMDPKDIEAIFGWELKPEGLCRDDVCIPVRDGLGADGRLSLLAFADSTDRPLVVSTEHSAGYLGPPRTRFGNTVGLLEAPDFMLPDVEGNLVTLSEHRGSKVLLAAWASW